MKTKVPWTKTMLDKFIDECLLTEDEERILRTRIAGWTIVKQSMEFGISTSSISRIIRELRRKYIQIQPKFPDIFPVIKMNIYELALDSTTLQEAAQCKHILDEFTTSCGKDVRHMTADEIIVCQKNCPYDDFYLIKK